MSESVTNAEVEDVLSSIRRLVGENKKPKPEELSSDAPDRLVLTPQLRVPDHDVLHLGPEAAVSSAEDWYEFEEPPLPDGSDMGLGTEADHGGPEEDQDTDDLVAIEAFSDAAETLEPASDEQARLDESEPEQPDVADGGAPSGTQRSDYTDLTAKIAALETAIARTKDQWEPDGEGRDAYAGTRAPAMMWRDNVELDGRGKPVGSAGPQQDDARAAPQSAHETTDESAFEDEEVIDENMLRDLVSEIVRAELAGDVVANAVRAELQGDLGARITRNIRKLVRREIQLALAAQGLE